ncbi:MAG: arabinosyltransferase C-terminal domain-containing protein, partial [Acidimicrobiia bacterium]|nr:arabinosyltransferase C-terminal domain-containing protein [Acidimicrobiia bacterium]
VQFGRRSAGGIEPLGVVPLEVEVNEPTFSSAYVDLLPGADVVRIAAVDDRTDESGWTAFSAPRLVSAEPLGAVLTGAGHALVAPQLNPMFPCVAPSPPLRPGIVDIPDLILHGGTTAALWETSPWVLTSDAFPVDRIDLVEPSGAEPTEYHLFRVVRAGVAADEIAPRVELVRS